MRILPITITNINNQPKRLRINNVPPSPNYNSHTSQVLPVNNITFARAAKNAERMRKLFKYGMIDIHSGQEVIDPQWFQDALQKGLFNYSIQIIAKVLAPFEKCLHKVESELFSELKQFAKTNPNYKLDDFVQTLAPKAQISLLKLQQPIFNKLKVLSQSMPQEQKQAFDELMQKTENQLANKPITYNFSKKEFNYQLERISNDIKRKGVNEEVDAIEKLIHMSKNIPYTPSGRNFKHKKTKLNYQKSLNQAILMRQMDNFFNRSVLKDDKSLQDLFLNAKKQVFNIPTVIPFKRKTFNHELKTITDTLKDTKLAREMMKTAAELPTAQEELSAFIMKSSRYSPTKIGHDLLYGSVGAIDHIEPFSLGGLDTISNYAFTSNALNSKRGNKTMQKWMLQNGDTYIGAQKCVDKLIELYKKGVLESAGLSPWYIVNFAKKMQKLSPTQKPLILDLGNLINELKIK